MMNSPAQQSPYWQNCLCIPADPPYVTDLLILLQYKSTMNEWVLVFSRTMALVLYILFIFSQHVRNEWFLPNAELCSEKTPIYFIVFIIVLLQFSQFSPVALPYLKNANLEQHVFYFRTENISINICIFIFIKILLK